jgi:Flp pilus assembly protein TadD
MPHADEAESPPDFDELATRARTAARRHDWGVSFALWSEALHLYPRPPESLASAGEALLNLSRYDQADEILTSATAGLPGEMRPAELRARVAHEPRDWPEALTRWMTRRHLFPRDPGWHSDVTDFLVASGHGGDARAALRETLALIPDDPESGIDLLHWMGRRSGPSGS